MPGELQIKSADCAEKHHCNVVATNSDSGLHVESGCHDWHLSVVFHPVIDEPDVGCSISRSLQVCSQDPVISRKRADQSIHGGAFHLNAQ